MRPIDADALIKKIQHDVAMDTNAIQYFGVTPEKEKALKDKIAVEQKCMNYINHAPSIDIVRCKECKRFGDEGWCFWRDVAIKPDDFCSYGEREGER